MGQLQSRLVRPYQQFPYSLAKLVDTSMTMNDRREFARTVLATRTCCRDPFFTTPVLEQMEQKGGPHAILPGSEFLLDLTNAFAGKCCNIQLELNFARASSSRQAMRGRKHVISSMTAKHIIAECKVSHINNLDGHQPRCRRVSARLFSLVGRHNIESISIKPYQYKIMSMLSAPTTFVSEEGSAHNTVSARYSLDNLVVFFNIIYIYI